MDIKKLFVQKGVQNIEIKFDENKSVQSGSRKFEIKFSDGSTAKASMTELIKGLESVRQSGKELSAIVDKLKKLEEEHKPETFKKSLKPLQKLLYRIRTLFGSRIAPQKRQDRLDLIKKKALGAAKQEKAGKAKKGKLTKLGKEVKKEELTPDFLGHLKDSEQLVKRDGKIYVEEEKGKPFPKQNGDALLDAIYNEMKGGINEDFISNADQVINTLLERRTQEGAVWLVKEDPGSMGMALKELERNKFIKGYVEKKVGSKTVFVIFPKSRGELVDQFGEFGIEESEGKGSADSIEEKPLADRIAGKTGRVQIEKSDLNKALVEMLDEKINEGQFNDYQIVRKDGKYYIEWGKGDDFEKHEKSDTLSRAYEKFKGDMINDFDPAECIKALNERPYEKGAVLLELEGELMYDIEGLEEKNLIARGVESARNWFTPGVLFLFPQSEDTLKEILDEE